VKFHQNRRSRPLLGLSRRSGRGEQRGGAGKVAHKGASSNRGRTSGGEPTGVLLSRSPGGGAGRAEGRPGFGLRSSEKTGKFSGQADPPWGGAMIPWACESEPCRTFGSGRHPAFRGRPGTSPPGFVEKNEKETTVLEGKFAPQGVAVAGCETRDGPPPPHSATRGMRPRPGPKARGSANPGDYGRRRSRS